MTDEAIVFRLNVIIGLLVALLAVSLWPLLSGLLVSLVAVGFVALLFAFAWGLSRPYR